MSIQPSFAILQTLQVLDHKIVKLEADLSTERAMISDKAERHAALLGRIARIDSAIGAMEGTRSELNQELRQHLLQVDKAREKMARCRNEREANAASREMEEIRRMCREREVEIQTLAGLITDARSDIKTLEDERDSVSGQIDETEGEAVLRVRTLQDKLLELQTKRASSLSQLPKTVQGRYAAVHARRGSGTAAVVDGSCAACHISLSPMLYQEMMRLQEFFQCANCLRLLYVSETTDRTDSSSDDDAADDLDKG